MRFPFAARRRFAATLTFDESNLAQLKARRRVITLGTARKRFGILRQEGCHPIK
jgi:hypothetical protein